MGIAEAQEASVARTKRERLQHLFTARGLLLEALRKGGQRDPDLSAHLMAVLLKLGEDARVVQGILNDNSMISVVPAGMESSETGKGRSSLASTGSASSGEPHRNPGGPGPSAVGASMDVHYNRSKSRGGVETPADRLDSRSDRSSETEQEEEDSPGGHVKFEYDEMKEGLLSGSDDEEEDVSGTHSAQDSSRRRGSSESLEPDESEEGVGFVSGDARFFGSGSAAPSWPQSGMSAASSSSDSLDSSTPTNGSNQTGPSATTSSGRLRQPPALSTVQESTDLEAEKDEQEEMARDFDIDPAVAADVASLCRHLPLKASPMKEERMAFSPRRRGLMSSTSSASPPLEKVNQGGLSFGAAGPPPGPPSCWNKADVGRWLQASGFPELVPKFAAQDVDGEVLLTLTNDELRGSDFEITLGMAKKLLKSISDLNAQEEKDRKEREKAAEPARSRFAGLSLPHVATDSIRQLVVSGIAGSRNASATIPVEEPPQEEVSPSPDIRSKSFKNSFGNNNNNSNNSGSGSSGGNYMADSTPNAMTPTTATSMAMPMSMPSKSLQQTCGPREMMLQQSPSRATLDTLSLVGSAAPSVQPSPFVGGAMARDDLTPTPSAAAALGNLSTAPSLMATPSLSVAHAMHTGSLSGGSGSDTVSVRVLNGVSGEEEVRFELKYQAGMTEQAFLTMLDRSCQQHAGQALPGLNWLSQSQPGERFERRRCDTNMIMELFDRLNTSRRSSATVLLLCTVPVRPPSELTAVKIRIKTLSPTKIVTGTPEPVRLQLDTSTLEPNHQYTVAFTHQWSNMTYNAQAKLLDNSRGVEVICPPQMVAPTGAQSKDGLYDVHLVVDNDYRSENRRTLTVGSAESELSSSSTRSASASSFVPIGRK